MSIVQQYWTGVLQRLEAEVHVFAQLVAHEGEKGRENEAVMSRILEALVPQRYGVGSGLLIDTHDKYSPQTDIVIYDQSDEPAVLAQTTQVLFPIESTLACIEVKTTLRADDIKDCLKKAKKTRKLAPARPYADGSTHPLFVVLAYRAGPQPKTIVKKFMDASDEERPDLICVVEQGILLGANGCIRAGSGAVLDAGLALKLEQDAPITAEPTGPSMRTLHRGRSYSLVRHGDPLLLVDPARALLLFVEALIRLLAERQQRREPVLSLYVTDEMRELAWHAQDGAPDGGLAEPVEAIA